MGHFAADCRRCKEALVKKTCLIFTYSFLTPKIRGIRSASCFPTTMTSTPLQKRSLRSTNTRRPPLPVSPPAKRTKMTVPPPLALGPSPASSVPKEPLSEAPRPHDSLKDGPSVFDILNVFRRRWFLNRDHLLVNILSAQKDDAGHIVWVDFLPPFHTH